MSMQIGVKGSFSEPELSLEETIRKLTRERDSALHQVAGLEVQVLELELSKEDAFTAIFQKGIAALREEFSKGLKDQKKEFEEFKQLAAPLFVERQIRLEKEAAEKEAEEKEAALSLIPNKQGYAGLSLRCKEKLRQGTLAQVKAFCEHHQGQWNSMPFLRDFLNGTIPFPIEESV